jgi:hypothetical protein
MFLRAGSRSFLTKSKAFFTKIKAFSTKSKGYLTESICLFDRELILFYREQSLFYHEQSLFYQKQSLIYLKARPRAGKGWLEWAQAMQGHQMHMAVDTPGQLLTLKVTAGHDKSALKCLNCPQQLHYPQPMHFPSQVNGIQAHMLETAARAS